MADLHSSLKKILALNDDVRVARNVLKKEELGFAAACEEFDGYFGRIYRRAIDEYNMQAQLKISKFQASCSLDLEKKEFRLAVELSRLSGYEPDGDLVEAEWSECEAAFAEVIKRHCAMCSIPITFAGLDVPHSYFSK